MEQNATSRVRRLQIELEDGGGDVRVVDLAIRGTGHADIVAEARVEDLAELGCYWLPDEDYADCALATNLLVDELKRKGYAVSWLDVLEGVKIACLPGPGEDPTQIETTLTPYPKQ